MNQLNITVRVSRDPLGRDDRNLQTGYQIDVFDWQVLKNPSTLSVTNEEEEKTSGTTYPEVITKTTELPTSK